MPPKGLSQSWQTQFDEALDDPKLTEFEREVLSDREITDAEYHEAQQRYATCMSDQGWEVTFRDDGSTGIGAKPGSSAERTGEGPPEDVVFGCQDISIRYIEPLHLGVRDNPEGLTHTQQVRACFEQHGVPDGAGLSDDQFAELIEDADFHASTREGVVCFWDPTGSEGLTFEEAQVYDQGHREKVTVSIPPSGDPIITTTLPKSGG